MVLKPDLALQSKADARPLGTSRSRPSFVFGGTIVAASGCDPPGYHRGDFRQGEWLKISILVERYGLSAAPIREALNQLEAEGLVELLPNRGARVRVITRDFIADLFEIRLAIEPILAQRSAAVASPEHVAQLIEYGRRVGEGIPFAGNRRHDPREPGFPSGAASHPAEQPGHRPDPPALRTRLIGAAPLRISRDSGYDTIIAEHNGLIDACRRRDGRADLQDHAHACAALYRRAPAAYSQVRPATASGRHLAPYRTEPHP